MPCALLVRRALREMTSPHERERAHRSRTRVRSRPTCKKDIWLVSGHPEALPREIVPGPNASLFEARLQAQEERVAGVMASRQERLARLEALLAGELYAQN